MRAFPGRFSAVRIAVSVVAGMDMTVAEARLLTNGGTGAAVGMGIYGRVFLPRRRMRWLFL